MRTTLHGDLPVVIEMTKEIPVSIGGRAELCRMRGVALGNHVNVTVTLDVSTGEVLLFSPDGFVGSFRMGDLVAAQVAGQVARAQKQREHAKEDGHVARAH